MTTSRTGSNGGLTLIELLVYLAVLALATALIVPAFTGSYRRYVEEALIQNLERDIRFAQYRSIMEGKAYALQYDARENAYHFLREERSGRRNVTWLPLKERWGKARKIGTGLTLFFRGNDKIYFLPDGEITEGSILLRSGNETIATLFLGRSLLGIETKRRGVLPHAA